MENVHFVKFPTESWCIMPVATLSTHRCNSCDMEIQAVPSATVSHRCPGNKSQKVTFETLPPIHYRIPTFEDGVVNLFGTEVWTDEDGYFYSSDDHGASVNVFDTFGEMIGAL